MNTEKGHLDTLEILEMARKTAEREELRYNIARRVCDMIAGKWHGKKINKRIAADAERVINDDKAGVPGGFNTLSSIEKMFDGIYPLDFYFKFEASKKVKE